MVLIWPPILYLGVDVAFNTTRGLWTVGIASGIGIAASWLWWSVAAPRWRLWAYQRVKDLELLEQLAVADKLVWPVKHPLTRTELRPGSLGERLRTYEAALEDRDVR